MKIKQALQEYLLDIEVRKYMPKTIRSYWNNRNLFLRYCETKVQISDVDEIILATIRQFTSCTTKAVVEEMKGEDSATEQLKKFKELMDSGVISQEEFDAKKKQLLGL